MKLEERLRRELHDTAEQLIISPDKYEEAVRRGRNRRRALVTSGVAGALAVGAVVAIALSLRPAPSNVVAVTTPTSAPTPSTTAAPLPPPAVGFAAVVARPKGITVEGLDGTGTTLQSDLYYEGISWVISDGAGGLIYQHDVTPLPWAQGTILRLAAGASDPQPLVAPPPSGYLRPLDVDNGILLFREDLEGFSTVMGLDLATLESHLVVPPTQYLIGASVESGQVVVALGGDCNQIAYYGIDGLVFRPPSWNDGACLPVSINDIAFTGEIIFTLEDGAGGRLLARRNLATGERSTVLVEDAWQISALPDGTIAFGGTEIRVGRFDGDSFDQQFSTSGANSFALVELEGFGENATLGSNLGELPCTPIDLPRPEPQDLPEPVEQRRQGLFSLAASCEMETLAEIARGEGIAFTYGGEDDPLRAWIRGARNGFDVMTWIVRILNAVPAIDPRDGSFAWPAVHVTNSEEDWQLLSGVLSSAEYEQFYSMRESGFLGLRIGIASDGTWLYAIAGD